MKLSIEMLRKFCDATKISHGALAAARDRMRTAKRAVEDAERKLDEYEAAVREGKIRAKDLDRKRSDGLTNDEHKLAAGKRAIADAKQAYALARAAHEREAEIHSHNTRLAHRGRDLAEELGVLPDDLKDW